MRIRKAVIACGGRGTRFLPVTKAIPKEMLPIIDTPVLEHIVNEAIMSGVTEILIIISNEKESIRKYFSKNKDLEAHLSLSGNFDLLKKVSGAYQEVDISFAIQEKARGNADAVLLAEEFVGKEPFLLSWGDDLIYSSEPVMKQLADNYFGEILIAVQECLESDVSKYGIIDGAEVAGNIYKCKAIIEKPDVGKAPSNIACFGRYLLTPEIFGIIKNTPLGKNGELQLADALCGLCPQSKVYAYEFEGKRYDMGDKLGATVAIVEYALRHKELGSGFKKYITALVNNLEGEENAK